MSRRSAALAVVLAIGTVPTLAHAQRGHGRTGGSHGATHSTPAEPATPPPAAPAPNEAAANEARAYFTQGQAAYARGEYEQAVEAWEHAYSIDPRPALQYNLAQAYGRLGDLDKELHALEVFVAGAQPNDAAVGPARMRIDAIHERLTRTGIRIVGGGGDVELTVDGTVTAIPPDNQLLSVSPGSHRIHARQRGHRPYDVTVDVVQGRTTEVTLDLPEVRQPHPPIMGYSLLGAGGGLLLTATGTGIAALAKSNGAFKGTPQGDRAHALGLTTDILIGVGAASAITGLVLVLTRDRGESDGYSSFHVQPYATRSGAGLSLDGRF